MGFKIHQRYNFSTGHFGWYTCQGVVMDDMAGLPCVCRGKVKGGTVF